jgi:hypothetical protein
MYEPEVRLAQPEDDAPSDALQLKAEALAAMAAHLREHGPKDWDKVREQPRFAHLIGRAAGERGRRKFWRWRKSLSAPTPADRTRPHETRMATEPHAAWARARSDEARIRGAANPTTAYLMRTGAVGVRKLDLFAVLVQQALDDAERVRHAVLVEDPKAFGGKAVSDPAMLLKANRSQLEVVNTAIRLQREINEVRQGQQFYESLIDILVGELADHPAALARILERMQQLTLDRGGAIHEAV